MRLDTTIDRASPDSFLKPFALYIHWPWCKAKCPYCDFNSHASNIQENDYIDGLLREFQDWNEVRSIGGNKTAAFTPTTRRVASVFFGGGTPSLISSDKLAQVIDSCRKLGVIDGSTEITVECNPTSFDEGRTAAAFFADLKAAGVNRVSIGIQGLKPEWLSFLGRTHRVEEALATLDAAQKAFDNVNADIIYGLPQQTPDEWVQQLQTLAGRGLAHISAYQLTIEKNTHFYHDVKRGLWKPISSDIEADFFDVTRTTLGANGYENYEISNFAKPGMACKHNTHVWQYGEYLGVGAGAHGRVTGINGRMIATQVIRQPEGYLKRIASGHDPVSQAITLDMPEAVQEAVFSGLRLATGVDMELLSKRFGAGACEEAISTPETLFLVNAGLLEYRNQYLALTTTGWPRLNGILERILRPLRPSPAHPSPAQNEYNRNVSVTIL